MIGFYCTDSQKTRDEFDDDYCCYCIRLGKEPTPDSYYRDWYDSQAPIPRYKNKEDVKKAIEEYESVPIPANLQQADLLRKELALFEPPAATPTIQPNEVAFSGWRIIGSVATNGIISAAPRKPPPLKDPIVEDPIAEMQKRHQERISKNNSITVSDAADLIGNTVQLAGVHSHGGGLKPRLGGHKQFTGGDASEVVSHVTKKGSSGRKKQERIKQHAEDIRNPGARSIPSASRRGRQAQAVAESIRKPDLGKAINSRRAEAIHGGVMLNTALGVLKG